MAKYRRRTPKVDNKQFIASFMKHQYADEVAADLGVPVSYVGPHAAYLRSRGVKVPKRYPNIDLDDLNAFIEKLESDIQKKDGLIK